MGPDDIRSRETIKGTVELDGATLDHVDCRLRGQYSGRVCGDKRNIREHVPPIWRTSQYTTTSVETFTVVTPLAFATSFVTQV